MANLKELKNKIGVIGSTKKVTSAMKLVSGVKLRKSEELMLASRRFSSDFIEIFNNINLNIYKDNLPEIFTGRERPKRVLLIVITSDRGLCGNFNSLVIKKAQELICHYHEIGVKISVKCFGKKGFDGLKNLLNLSSGFSQSSDLNPNVNDLNKNSGDLNKDHELANKCTATSGSINVTNAINDDFFIVKDSDQLNECQNGYCSIDPNFDTIDLLTNVFQSDAYDNVNSFAKEILNLFNRQIIDETKIIFTQYITTTKRVVVSHNLIPVTQSCDINDLYSKHKIASDPMRNHSVDDNKQYFLFEPGENKILELILPYFISIQIYQACLDSVVSEHSARMIAMNNATNNAEELFNKMTISYNRIRQAKITQELIEIVSGAESLN